LETFRRASELLGTSNSATEHMMVRWGTWNVHYGRAELNQALQAAESCLATAARYRLGEALASRLMGQTLCTMGNFVDARRHLQSGISLGISGNHEDFRASADNHVTCLTYLSLTLWPMGRLDEAEAAATRGLVRARELGHVVTTAIALHTSVVLGTYGGEPALAAQHASEALAFAMKHRLANYAYWAHFNQGVLMAQSGDAQRGIEIMRAAAQAAPERVRQQFRPRSLAHMAAAHCAVGEADAAIPLIDEAFQIVEATNERQFEAELHRVRGEIFLKASQATEGEAELQAALTVARRQNAQLWALRAATSLAHHWLGEGRDHDEARRLLVPIRRKIHGGSHLPDLIRADALLGR
jgi:predicted ATPase